MTGTAFCPGDDVARSQMAIFIAKGIAGGGANVPSSGTIGATGYNCTAGGTSLFFDVSPTDIFCKHVHYIASKNVTSGCSTGKYCPANDVSRLDGFLHRQGHRGAQWRSGDPDDLWAGSGHRAFLFGAAEARTSTSRTCR